MQKIDTIEKNENGNITTIDAYFEKPEQKEQTIKGLIKKRTVFSKTEEDKTNYYHFTMDSKTGDINLNYEGLSANEKLYDMDGEVIGEAKTSINIEYEKDPDGINLPVYQKYKIKQHITDETGTYQTFKETIADNNAISTKIKITHTDKKGNITITNYINNADIESLTRTINGNPSYIIERRIDHAVIKTFNRNGNQEEMYCYDKNGQGIYPSANTHTFDTNLMIELLSSVLPYYETGSTLADEFENDDSFEEVIKEVRKRK